MMKGHTLRTFVILASCAATFASCKHAEKNEAGAPTAQTTVKMREPLNLNAFESKGRKPASVKNLQNGQAWQKYFNFVFDKRPESKQVATSNLRIYTEEADRLAEAVSKKDAEATQKSVQKFQKFLLNQYSELPASYYQALVGELVAADRIASTLDFKDQKITNARYAALLTKTKALQATLRTFNFLNSF
jgi:hypothetical protein